MKHARFLLLLSATALVFAFTLSGLAATKYKVLHNFGAGSDGQYPAGGVTPDSRGNLYGATTGGDTGCKGEGSGGTLFRLAPSGDRWREKILYCFAGQYIDGFPDSGLTVDGSGDLFGTAAGGPGGLGDVFELTPSGGGWNFSTIYAYHGGCCLVLDQAGNLYGGIGQGKYHAGAIGELSPGSNGWIYTDLYDFCPPPRYCGSGELPYAPLSWDLHGNLYGTTLEGGEGEGYGVVFRMTPNGDGTWNYRVIHYFGIRQNDGILPYAGLVLDAAGNAYGATSAGGVNNTGVVFELSPSPGGHWKETILYDFPHCVPDGCAPVFTLTLDQDGNLYGSAQGGDTKCGPCGVVFKLAPQKNGKWEYSVVHTFHGSDGAGPYGVILDSKGNIFGTTGGGGKYNMGVAFELTP